jgi:hypothetical protein
LRTVSYRGEEYALNQNLDQFGAADHLVQRYGAPTRFCVTNQVKVQLDFN